MAPVRVRWGARGLGEGRWLMWPPPHAQSLRDQANDQAMCVEPDFSTNRDQTLCGDHDAGAVFVQLSAHWLIAPCRKVRLHARRLIPIGGRLLGGGQVPGSGLVTR
jgi:hypothetical protein